MRDAQSWGWINPDKSWLHTNQLVRCWQAADRSTLSITPSGPLLIPPYAIPQVSDVMPIRALALLATPLGASKPDDGGQLSPVDRVKPTVFACNRHDNSMSHAA
jgi:hypothetical protein